MYICNALLHHGYSSFTLTILEYINISNLSKENARKLILERKQHYIDSLKPGYNMNPIAGSRLGSKYTEQTKALLSEANLGKSLSIETKAILRVVSLGSKNPMFGKTHTEKTRILMSVAKTGENHFNLGKSLSAETKAKISKKVFVYNVETPTIVSHEFVSCSEAVLHFSCRPAPEGAGPPEADLKTISRYLKSDKLFQKKWILSSSKK
jgi:group I intron endonuclease